MSFCGKCGARNPDGAAFCGSCGAPLDKPAEPVADKPGRAARKPSTRKPEPAAASKQTGKPGLLWLAFAAAVLFLGFKIAFPSTPMKDGKLLYRDFTAESNADMVTRSGIFDTRSLRFGMGRGEVEAVLSGLSPDMEVVSDFCGDQVRMLGYKGAGYNGRDDADMSVGFSSTGALCMVGYSAGKDLYDGARKQLKSMYGDPSSVGGVTAWQLASDLCIGLVSEYGREGVVIWDSGQMPVSWADLIGQMKDFLSKESGRYAMKACIDTLFLVNDSMPKKYVGTIETPYGDRRIKIEGDPDYDAMHDDMQAIIKDYRKMTEAIEAGN